MIKNHAWSGGFTPGIANNTGGANIISTPQGSLNCTATTVSKAGNALTINWKFTPAEVWAGTTKNLYLYVRDLSLIHI